MASPTEVGPRITEFVPLISIITVECVAEYLIPQLTFYWSQKMLNGDAFSALLMTARVEHGRCAYIIGKASI